MDNVLLFNNYEDLENSLKRLADTDHYTVKRVVAEPDWYREDYALAIQYDGFRFDYDLNYMPTKDLKIAVTQDDWDKLKLAVRLTELSYNFYNYSKDEVSVVTKFKLISDSIEQFNVNVSEQTLNTTNLSNKDIAKLLAQEVEKQIAYSKDKVILFKN